MYRPRKSVRTAVPYNCHHTSVFEKLIESRNRRIEALRGEIDRAPNGTALGHVKKIFSKTYGISCCPKIPHDPLVVSQLKCFDYLAYFLQ